MFNDASDINELLALGVSADAQLHDFGCCRPVMDAVKAGRVDAVRELLVCGASPHPIAEHDAPYSPMHFAKHGGHLPEVAQALAGVDARPAPAKGSPDCVAWLPAYEADQRPVCALIDGVKTTGTSGSCLSIGGHGAKLYPSMASHVHYASPCQVARDEIEVRGSDLHIGIDVPVAKVIEKLAAFAAQTGA